MKTTNQEIVSEARKWLGTPFHYQGRIRGIGCDCLGLVVGVASALGIHSKQGGKLASYDVQDYDHTRDQMLLHESVEKHLVRTAKLEIGSIVVIKCEGNPQHIGIIGDYPYGKFSLIHACMKSDKVVEHRVMKKMLEQIKGIYSFYN